MTYAQGMKKAILHDWSFCRMDKDAAYGNGFEITGYGLKLITLYSLGIIFRVIFALLFPISAVIMIKLDDEANNRRNERSAKVDNLHK